LVILGLAAGFLHGHPPASEVAAEVSHAAPAGPPMLLPPLDPSGAKPWSNKPVLNDPRRFQFAVMSDRTGGHRPGIWMHAVRNLNLLRPQFVVSVGDLIEGYTEDTDEIERQWTEFLEFIDQLQMRFFFVAGNHDVTNPTMHYIWRQHFGVEWYSFDYQGVHFVCLCSEDPEQSRLGEEQLEWLATDLQEHDDARWTFVFLHKPLWVYSERARTTGDVDRTNWPVVERLLGDRPHTVFAGHVHHYLQFSRNGRDYYQLATTGGGSQLRGQDYGEFDHVTWVTMEKDGPHIANILLDGVLPADAVTEDGLARFREFLAAARIVIEPVLLDDAETFQEATLCVRLDNTFSEPVRIEAKLDGFPQQGLTLDPVEFTMQADPGGTAEQQCRVHMNQPLHYAKFGQATLTTTIFSDGQDPLQAELSLPVTIDRERDCPRLAVTVDGDLSEWSGVEEEFAEQPTIFGARQQWQGLADGSMRFRLAWHDNSLYLSGQVHDDAIVAGRDRVSFSIDGREMPARLRDRRLGDSSWTVDISPQEGASYARIGVRSRGGEAGEPPVALAVACRPRDYGYDFEAAVSTAGFAAAQGNDWRSFQLNAYLRDVDEPEEEECYIIWRGGGTSRDNSSYAHFFRTGGD
jgi:hypothetical protein